MFINETYSDLQKGKCDNCKNNDICKWKSEVIQVNTEIENVVFDKELPIHISVICKRFDKNETKRSVF